MINTTRTCLVAIGYVLMLSLSANAQNSDPALVFSRSDTDMTPLGNVQFHGPFSAERIIISKGDLPAHEFVEISFDLLILRSWDGLAELDTKNKPTAVGPDYFRLGIAGGPTLLYTTFSNVPNDPGFRAISKFQTYPSQVPGDRRTAQNGASQVNRLGYHYPWPDAPRLFPMDATYHIQFTVPHQDSKIVVEMEGMNLQNIIDENWGIVRMHVNPLPAGAVTHPDADAVAKAFDEAINPTSADPSVAFQTLVNGGDDVAWWLKANIEAKPVNAEKVGSLIKDLSAGDRDMTTREAARLSLLGMGPQVEPFLRDARKSASGELRLRIDWVLEYLEVTPISDEGVRKVMLATRVLEIIGTPRAMEVRRQLVQN